MKELADMIEAVAYEKGMPEEAVRDAMEAAIAALARKEQKEPGGAFHAEIEPKTGEVNVWRLWDIVDNVMDEDRERLGSNVGDVEHDTVETPKWTRQGLQVVKQVLAQRLKQGLRKTIADNWKGREGDIVLGVVKRIDKNRVLVDLGEPAEGVLAGRGRIPGEMFKVGHRVRAVVQSVNEEGHGPVIELSRTSEEFLRELIAVEVPEVDLGQVIIRAVARDAGQRAKIAVEAGLGLRNHPTAVCIGMRGVRAQAISGELNGERLEFIEWNDNPAELLVAAMEPAEITKLVMDETTKTATVAVDQTKMARAIGSRGQNIRLASKLTGWTIELLSNDDFEAKSEAEVAEAKEIFINLMDLDEEFAAVLTDEGFLTIDDIYFCSVEDLMSISGIDEDTALVLKERAGEAMTFQQYMNIEDDSLLSLDKITQDEVIALNALEVNSLQDMADLGLGDIEWNDDEQLSAWIMQARKKVGMI